MFMTRLEKCVILKKMGYTYDANTGKIFGVKGKEIIRKDDKGYICLFKRGFGGSLFGHHFAFYMTYDNVDFIMLDHINRDKSDNRISNLRVLTNQENTWNSDAKGYYWHSLGKKWSAQIHLDYQRIHLGLFDNEEEARNAYLQAKEKYHNI